MKFLTQIFSVFFIVTLTACANQTPEPSPMNAQGLTTFQHSAFDKLEINRSIDFSQYKKIKFDPATVAYNGTHRRDLLNRGEEAFQFDERELEIFNRQLVKGFSSAWAQQFGWEVTEETGSDVILVRAAIVDMYLYASIKNDEILPHSSITDESSKMTIKLSLLDSQSEQLLLTAQGKKTTGWRGQLTRTSSVSYWNDAYRAFLQWASLVGNQITNEQP